MFKRSQLYLEAEVRGGIVCTCVIMAIQSSSNAVKMLVVNGTETTAKETIS